MRNNETGYDCGETWHLSESRGTARDTRRVPMLRGSALAGGANCGNDWGLQQEGM